MVNHSCCSVVACSVVSLLLLGKKATRKSSKCVMDGKEVCVVWRATGAVLNKKAMTLQCYNYIAASR